MTLMTARTDGMTDEVSAPLCLAVGGLDPRRIERAFSSAEPRRPYGFHDREAEQLLTAGAAARFSLRSSPPQ